MNILAQSKSLIKRKIKFLRAKVASEKPSSWDYIAGGIRCKASYFSKLETAKLAGYIDYGDGRVWGLRSILVRYCRSVKNRGQLLQERAPIGTGQYLPKKPAYQG